MMIVLVRFGTSFPASDHGSRRPSFENNDLLPRLRVMKVLHYPYCCSTALHAPSPYWLRGQVLNRLPILTMYLYASTTSGRVSCPPYGCLWGRVSFYEVLSPWDLCLSDLALWAVFPLYLSPWNLFPSGFFSFGSFTFGSFSFGSFSLGSGL